MHPIKEVIPAAFQLDDGDIGRVVCETAIERILRVLDRPVTVTGEGIEKKIGEGVAIANGI